MTIENQNAYLIQLAVSLSLSAIHLELTEMMDYHGKANAHLLQLAVSYVAFQLSMEKIITIKKKKLGFFFF